MKLVVRFSLIFSLGLIIVGMVNCGSDSSTATTLSEAMGAIAITSPTAASASTSASTWNKKEGFFASLVQFTWFTKLFFKSGVESHAAAASISSDIKPPGEVIADIKSAMSADPSTTATALGNPLEKGSAGVDCYGPSWKDTATGSTESRPGGDLGIVYGTVNTTDTTACAAGQMNVLVNNYVLPAQKFIKLQAVMLAAGGKAGAALPAEGETKDFTANMPTFSGMTLSNADLIQLSKDADGNKVYKSLFDFTDASSKSGQVTILHTPTNADNTNFKGYIKMITPHNTTLLKAMTVVYSQTDGVQTFGVRTCANRTSSDSAFFGTDGLVSFAKTACGEDLNWFIGTYNTTTNAAITHYAWQAGASDGASRAFAMNIPAGTAGSLTGTAYFGFGSAMTSLTAATAPWPARMFCRWAAGGLSSGDNITKVQKQTMTQSSGKFIVGTNNISFAPTNSCSNASAWAITESSASFLNNASKSAVTNDLVTPPTSSDIAAVTEPTYTVP